MLANGSIGPVLVSSQVNMRDLRAKSLLAILALVAVCGASALLAVLPVYQTQRCITTGSEEVRCTTEKRTLIEESEDAAPFLLIPVLVVGLAAATTFVSHPAGNVVTWVIAVIVLLFCLITGFSIGVFFVPGALLLIAAAAVDN